MLAPVGLALASCVGGEVTAGGLATFELPAGFEAVETSVDARVITDVALHERLTAIALPWRIRHVASGIELLLVPPGSFERGAPGNDVEASPDERPSHEVLVPAPYWIARTEVTQAQWRRVMGDSPSFFAGDARPVESVAFVRAMEFASRAGMEIPTESEWEYACRAGSPDPRHGALDDIAWHGGRRGNAARVTHDVALKAPNALGLHDMLGNVQEWTSSGFLEGEYEYIDPPVDARGRVRGAPRIVVRGGSWYDPERRARASARYAVERDLVASHIGVRVILRANTNEAEAR